MARRIVGAVIAVVLVLAPATVLAETSQAMVIGTYVDPPFVIKDDEGEWHGVAIGLWREIARRENISFRIEEYELEGLLEALDAGRVDLAVGPLLITAKRERRYDMTSPFMHVALAIATRPVDDLGLVGAVVHALRGPLGTAALGLLAALFGFAVVVWLLERRRNPDHFGGGTVKGIGDAIWWSATTMTTVGYGDRTPITFWGRVVGVVWMFVSVVLVSAFIATVSSSLTVIQLQPRIRSLHDLAHVRVGAVAGSGVAEVLASLGIATAPYPNVTAGMNDILAGDIVAFVDEWPVLRYLAHHEYAGEVSIVPQTFSRGFVGFALPLDSPRRRQLNVALLEVLGDPAWQELTRKYLGQ